MDYKTKSNLIAGLANELMPNNDDLKISTSNYIEDTGRLDCTALGLSIDTLRKTANVIQQYITVFSADPEKYEASQYLAHLRVAKRCVEEIIFQKENKCAKRT